MNQWKSRSIFWIFAASLCFMVLGPITHGQDAEKAPKAEEKKEAAPESYDLRAMLKAGDLAEYEITSKQQQTQAAMGREMQRSMETKARLQWRVLSADAEGGGEVEITVLSMVIVHEMEGQRVSSDDPGDNPLAQSDQELIEVLKEQPIRLKLGADGSWPDWQELEAQFTDPETQEQLITIVRDLARLMGPLEGVSAGMKPQQEWSSAHSDRQGEATLGSNQSHRFLGVEKIAGIPIAMLQSTVKMDVSLDNEEIALSVNDGTGTIQTMYDLSRHEVVGRNTQQVLDATMTLGSGDEEMQINLRMNVSSQVLRVKEESGQ